MDAPHERFTNEGELLDVVAQTMAEGKIVGWFHGRMEFGPRALGARSIIGDARNSAMQATMNLKIKFRESFRPFAPCVLQERAHEYFGMRPGQESPYMLLVAPVLERHRTDTHVDYSARVQTVDERRHGRFYRLMKRFESLTGCPVIVNTSFNVRGEPIVCTPQEAYRCFLATEMDMLVLEDFVLRKERTSQTVTAGERAKYLAQFELD
jgi:carbamoyltransferase